MNKTTKHTPGPWKVNGNSITRNDNAIALVNQYGAGEVSDGEVAPWHSAEANARLIASSPELLSALKEAKKILQAARRYFPKSIRDSDRFALENVMANSVNRAIAKAEGRDA